MAVIFVTVVLEPAWDSARLCLGIKPGFGVLEPIPEVA
jgi:hypothetical protein